MVRQIGNWPSEGENSIKIHFLWHLSPPKINVTCLICTFRHCWWQCTKQASLYLHSLTINLGRNTTRSYKMGNFFRRIWLGQKKALDEPRDPWDVGRQSSDFCHRHSSLNKDHQGMKMAVTIHQWWIVEERLQMGVALWNGHRRLDSFLGDTRPLLAAWNMCRRNAAPNTSPAWCAWGFWRSHDNDDDDVYGG